MIQGPESDKQYATKELHYNIQSSKVEVATAIARSLASNSGTCIETPEGSRNIGLFACSMADKIWDHYQMDETIKQEDKRKADAVLAAHEKAKQDKENHLQAMIAVQEEKQRLAKQKLKAVPPHGVDVTIASQCLDQAPETGGCVAPSDDV